MELPILRAAELIEGSQGEAMFDFQMEALKQRAAGDSLLGRCVTTDDIKSKAAMATDAAHHYAIAARFEELHFDSITGEHN